MEPHLMFVFPDHEAFRPFLDDEGRDAAATHIGIRHGEHDVGVRFPTIRDEDLGAVQHIVVTPVFRLCFQALCIGSRTRFRQAECPKVFPAGKLGYIGLFLFFRTEIKDRIRADRRMDRQDDPDGGAHPRQLMDGNDVGSEIHSCASILFRDRDSHQSELCHLVQDLPGEFPIFHPLDEWTDLRVSKVPYHLPHHLLLFCETKFHASFLPVVWPLGTQYS